MQWCLEFCDFNNAVSRPLLVDTIRYSYIRHRREPALFRARHPRAEAGVRGALRAGGDVCSGFDGVGVSF